MLSNIRSVGCAFVFASMLAACNAPAQKDAASTATTAKEAAAAGASSQGPGPAARPGPDILTTVSDTGEASPTEVAAQFGKFQIKGLEGVDTLVVDGQPVMYTPEGTDFPMAVTANSSLSLIGVFELQQESVAWVVIGGGSACAGTHLLVSVGQTRKPAVSEIKGCDDRGTMRKVEDRIVFQAGGTSGAYDHGRLVAS